MLYSASKTNGYHLNAIDGELGKVRDLLFDDRSWTIRYLVVDLGGWLPGRQVLLSPAAIGDWQWAQGAIGISLTQEQIRHSPDVNTDLPVARQHEEQLARYYGWPMYWVGPIYTGIEPVGLPPPMGGQDTAEHEEPKYDPHLRSFEEVRGYHIQALDTRIGHLHDLLYDARFVIRYIEIDTRRWLHGRRILVPPSWAQKVEWQGRLLDINLTSQQIQTLPEYEPGLSADQYDQRLREWGLQHQETL